MCGVVESICRLMGSRGCGAERLWGYGDVESSCRLGGGDPGMGLKGQREGWRPQSPPTPAPGQGAMLPGGAGGQGAVLGGTER